MDSRDLEQIESFLGMVGKPSLFAYYDIRHESSDAGVEATVKKRRTWAQGQQANPKFRTEALWLIKNNTLIRRTLLQERESYLVHVGISAERQSLQKLEPFMRGTLAGGVLTPEAEQAILDQGRKQGLSDAQVRGALQRLVAEVGAHENGPSPVAESTPAASSFKDYYAVLGIDPNADQSTLEKAHREKYRSARNRRDKQLVSALYADLDEAWRILTDPARKASYDAQWRAATPGVLSPGTNLDELKVTGFLPPPVNPEKADPPKPPQQSAAALSQATKPEPPPISMPKPLLIDTPTEESAPPRRGPPPKPKGIGGRTLGLKNVRRPRRATPRLAVPSPEINFFAVWRKPQIFSVTIKNIGDGRMAGRVVVDRGWVRLSRTQLDPDAEQQEVEVTINPKELNSRRDTALLTIVTEHGERKTITINAERKGLSLSIILGGLVGLLGACALGALLFLTGKAEPTSLVVLVEPMADVVEINGLRIGDGAMLVLDEGFPIGEPFTLSTRLQNFSTDERQVVANKGERNQLRVVLNPEPKLRPEAEPDAEMNKEALNQAIELRSARLGDCLAPGEPVFAIGDIALGPTGKLLYLKIDPASLPDATQAACVERQLYLVDYPGHGGTLAIIDAHPIKITPGVR